MAAIGLMVVVAFGNWLETAIGEQMFGTLLVSIVLGFWAYVAVGIYINTRR